MGFSEHAVDAFENEMLRQRSDDCDDAATNEGWDGWRKTKQKEREHQLVEEKKESETKKAESPRKEKQGKKRKDDD